MASQRQHRSRLAARLGKLRRALARGSVLAGSVLTLGLGFAAPVNASVQLERQALEARVQAVRAMLREPVAADAVGGTAGVAGLTGLSGEEPPLRTAQWFNWNNWNNWNNWKNWGNWLNR